VEKRRASRPSSLRNRNQRNDGRSVIRSKLRGNRNLMSSDANRPRFSSRQVVLASLTIPGVFRNSEARIEIEPHLPMSNVGRWSQLASLSVYKHSTHISQSSRMPYRNGRPFTCPAPSRKVSSWLAATDLICSTSPEGQWTSMSAVVTAPRPKCRRGSFEERKLDWLNNS